jgi:hypothetical protein
MTAVRLIARLLAVVLIAIGTGFIAYGAAVDAASFHAPAGITILYGPAETLAWGVGMLIGGVLFLGAFGLRAPQFDKPGKP